MVNPIQSNEFLSAAGDRGVKRGQQEPSSQGTPAAGGGDAAPAADDQVQVSEAGRILSGAAGRSPTSAATPEQAGALAAHIRDQILGGGPAALTAHGGGDPGQLSRLLATPAG